MLNRSTFLVALALMASSVIGQAATFRFVTDPFAGSDALTTPGRQIVGNELFIPNFSVATDLFSFDPAIFGVGDQVLLVNDVAANIPPGGVNIVVNQTTDNDNDPTTPFGAGAAANLIAAQITDVGPGFFIYFNSGLNLPRLVFSTDLSDNTADLKILARMTNLTGQDGINALPTFSQSNFAITPVPEPSSLLLTAGSMCLIGLVLRRRRA